MSENGVVRFPHGNLDPSAQEFRPTFPAQPQPQPHPHHHPHPFSFIPPPPPPYFPEIMYAQQTSSYVSHAASPTYLPPSIPAPASSPTRAVLLTAVPPEVSESIVRRELEIFGDVRAVQMGRVSEGIVTVHFYDLRAAHAALDAVRDQHMQHQNRLRIHYSSILAPNSFGPGPLGLEALAGPPPSPPPSPGLIAGRPVWAQFTVPATNAFPDGQNQGTLVIFNLNPTVSALTLKDIFQAFGAVKELRETPMKRQQRFVEFFDVRDASRALAEMNGKEINGRSVMIEFSRPGGYSNKKFNPHFNKHTNTQSSSLNFHHHNHYNSKPLRFPSPQPPQQQPPPFSLRHHRRTSPRQNSIRRRRSSPSSDESLETVLGGLTLQAGRNNEGRKYNGGGKKGGFNKNNLNVNVNGNGNGNCSSSGSGSSSSPSMKQQQQQQQHNTSGKVKPWRKQKNFDPRFLIKEDAIVVGTSSTSSAASSSYNKDTRTTVMIKNIPNKYSQKLLLNMLDNHCIHCNEQIAAVGGEDDDDDDHDHDDNHNDDQPLSSYDFVYLPIDFNNKCNVGYGFVNMTSPEATLRLYKAFHHQHWEVFNSRKICEVTYARVQGLEALKEHFKNSKFACENDEYLPVVFSPPRDGRHLPAPLPIVLPNTASSPTLHLHHDMDGSDFAPSTTLTTTASTSSTCAASILDHDHDHIINLYSATITEGHDDGDERVLSSSSNGGGCGDDDGSSNSSMGCSVGD